MHRLVLAIQQRGLIFIVYLANIFLSFHYFITAYVGSSFLGTTLNERGVSLLYILSALLNITLFYYAPKILKKFGNYKATITLSIIDILAVVIIALSPSTIVALTAFVVFQAVLPSILFNFDIFLEYCVRNEGVTGEVRGLYLTMSNIALVIAPLIMAGLQLGNHDFSPVFILSALFMVPLITIVMISFRHFEDPYYHDISLRRDWSIFFKNKDTRGTLVADILLQFFFGITVIYMMQYLNRIIGFSWTEIGQMFSIVLLPFLIFELPVGYLADKYFGEKEMMGIGFVLIGVFLFLVTQVHQKDAFMFTILLFMTRVGAALVEATCESHFFKKTNGSDTDLVSIFRISRPLAYVLAPLFGILVFTFAGYTTLFILTSVIMLSGLIFVLQLTDTR